MKVGVDIDGVVADVMPLWLKTLENAFQRKMPSKAGMHFNEAEVYGLTYEQLEQFYRNNESLFVRESLPMKGAVEHLARLMTEHQVYLVSARFKSQLENTINWLVQHDVPYTELILLGSIDKRQTCVDFNLEIFVEDSLANACQLAVHGIPVLLLDAPYNQGELPAGVTRCFNWAEIYELILDQKKGL